MVYVPCRFNIGEKLDDELILHRLITLSDVAIQEHRLGIEEPLYLLLLLSLRVIGKSSPTTYRNEACMYEARDACRR